MTAPQPATDPAGPTGRLADWLCGLTLEQVPTAASTAELSRLLAPAVEPVFHS